MQFPPTVMTTFKNEFSWSVSRDDIFQKCQRMYYFQYYGSWGGWDKDQDNRTRLIYILKQLMSRQMWAGKKVHDCVEIVIKEIQESKKKIDVSQKIEGTLNQMRKEFLSSKNKKYITDPKSCALFEHEYRLDVSDTEWKSNADNVAVCLSQFFDSDIYEEISEFSENQWVYLEQFPYFYLNDVKIYAVLDFAFRRNNQIVIYDWKTGRESPAKDKFQLACYGLFAAKKWNIEPKNINLVDFFLSSGNQYEYNFVDFDIDKIQEQILNSIYKMKNMLDDSQENIAREDNFIFSEAKQTCKYCNYYKICPKKA